MVYNSSAAPAETSSGCRVFHGLAENSTAGKTITAAAGSFSIASTDDIAVISITPNNLTSVSTARAPAPSGTYLYVQRALMDYAGGLMALGTTDTYSYWGGSVTDSAGTILPTLKDGEGGKTLQLDIVGGFHTKFGDDGAGTQYDVRFSKGSYHVDVYMKEGK